MLRSACTSAQPVQGFRHSLDRNMILLIKMETLGLENVQADLCLYSSHFRLGRLSVIRLIFSKV